MSVTVLEAEVWWGDGYMNPPTVTFTVDRAPRWDVYDKRPCIREQLSSEQAAIVGAPVVRARNHRDECWHVYWAEDDGFVTFFTWGGKPDDGFGGSRRTIRLTDGSEEEIVGGWHTIPEVATQAGLPQTVDTTYRLRPESGGIACFIDIDRYRREIAAHLPDVELVGDTVKWRGQITKAEFMAAEQARRHDIRERLKAKYHDGTWHGGDWYAKATAAERAPLEWRPYSALGPARVPVTEAGG